MTHSLDQVLLSYAVRHRRFMYDMTHDIGPEFFEKGYSTLYNLLLTAFKATGEIISVGAVVDMATERGLPEKALLKIPELYGLVAQLSEAYPDTDFKYHLAKLKKRRISTIASEGAVAISEAFESGHDVNISDTLEEIYQSNLRKIHSINSAKVYDEGTIGDDVKNMLDEYLSIKENADPFVGVLTGLRSFDGLTSGLHRSELTLIGGMEGSGKSLLMMNIAINAWLGSNQLHEHIDDLEAWIDSAKYADDGNTILYFSLEMPRSNKGKPTQASYFLKRMLACVARLKISEMRKGLLPDSEFEHLRLVAKFIESYEKFSKRFYVVDIPRGATVLDIEQKYLEVREKIGDIDLVVVDYLGIMSAAKNEADHLVQSQVAADLHEFARTYDLPVLSAVQLNRPSGQTNSLTGQRYNTNRVGRSAGITHHANNVLIIETRDDEHEKEGMIVHLVKLRDGEKGRIILTKDFARMRVIDEIPLSESQNEFEDASEDFI